MLRADWHQACRTASTPLLLPPMSFPLAVLVIQLALIVPAHLATRKDHAWRGLDGFFQHLLLLRRWLNGLPFTIPMLSNALRVSSGIAVNGS
ncbi:Uncharacterised protein [Salmonella enterica subsp. enterica]|nr:Uncharacterised protein [Salmonella enterica subsp. enterica]